MIIKTFQLNNLDLNKNNTFLLHGKNEGLKDEVIEKYFTKNFKDEINRYEENEFINNNELIVGEVLNKSLFSDKKILLISRATDKITKFIEPLTNKNLKDIIIILKSGLLEKKSKLRNLFEKDKFLISIAFYEDESKSLLQIITQFIKKNKIKISRESINLIIERARGDRKNLYIELDKIYNYSLSNKNLEYEIVSKLTNLAENYGVSELADQYLCKNVKQITKILNENNFSDEDCILILRTILMKSKRLLGIIKINRELQNIDDVINGMKPPIFWKDKENVKKQAKTWDLSDLQNKIFEINEIEALIKSNAKNSLNIISDFIVNY